jgi:hypothetical protein
MKTPRRKRTKRPSTPSTQSTRAPRPPGRRAADVSLVVERVQTGVRIEKRILKVLKALAEYHDLSLGDLLEGIVLHAFDGKLPFDGRSRALILDFKRIYGLTLDSSASHRLKESNRSSPHDAAER